MPRVCVEPRLYVVGVEARFGHDVEHNPSTVLNYARHFLKVGDRVEEGSAGKSLCDWTKSIEVDSVAASVLPSHFRAITPCCATSQLRHSAAVS